jgi:hypothetical protein
VARNEKQLTERLLSFHEPIDDRVSPADLQVGDEVIYNHPVLGSQHRRVKRLHHKHGMLVGFFAESTRFLRRNKPIELGRIVKAWR